MINSARYGFDTYDAWRTDSPREEWTCEECDTIYFDDEQYHEELECCNVCAIKEYESRINEIYGQISKINKRG